MSNKQVIEILDEMIEGYKHRMYLAYCGNPQIEIDRYAKQELMEARNRIQSLPDTDEWISADNPPDDSHGYVLCYVNYLNSLGTSYYIDILNYNKKNGVFSDGVVNYNVTHWKPLPTPPITK